MKRNGEDNPSSIMESSESYQNPDPTYGMYGKELFSVFPSFVGVPILISPIRVLLLCGAGAFVPRFFFPGLYICGIFSAK